MNPDADKDTEIAALKIELRAVQLERDTIRHNLNQVFGSTSWKITKPIRLASFFLRYLIAELRLCVDAAKKQLLKLLLLFQKVNAQRLKNPTQVILILDTATVPLSDVAPFIESVRNQSYPFWELKFKVGGATPPAVLSLVEAYSDEDGRVSLLIETIEEDVVAAKGELCLVLNSFDILAPTSLYASARRPMYTSGDIVTRTNHPLSESSIHES